MEQLDVSEFASKITNRSLNITIAGLGKMGLPIALTFTHEDFNVTGYDISKELVDQLNTGQTNLNSEPEVPERLQTAVTKGLFRATTDSKEAVRDTDVVIVIIPILGTDEGQQDLSVLKELYTDLAQACNTDTLFVQESTLAPRTSRDELWPILDQATKNGGVSFGLVFAPERTLSGRAIQDIEENYPKLLGGIHDSDSQIAALLYETVAQKGVIQLSDATTAEAVKTFKGAYRDANIAIANQFAIMADKYEVDILEVIDAANTEPYSHIHRPGIGVGGHCIPVYPKFLIHSSTEAGFSPDILVKSRQANDFMVDYAIEVVEKYGNDMNKVLILGLAYRAGVKEYRHSPTLRLLPQLRAQNIDVTVVDPLYTANEIDNIFGEGTGIGFPPADYSDYDTIFITTDHDEFKGLEPILSGTQVFDGRYVLEPHKFDGVLFQPGRLSLKRSE